ncbi:hypothetical protein FAIPA1_40198 [Frankia sp. AiPs1]
MRRTWTDAREAGMLMSWGAVASRLTVSRVTVRCRPPFMGTGPGPRSAADLSRYKLRPGPDVSRVTFAWAHRASD